ncbi:low-density lipoprotein receptor-related protein 4-like isoform X2 [Corticium candelabrum]|uniref:low-density lipoprotein receptor-related protein 4-like isoform X2 n=1 Tax=Corticium candelabrum TaxID=121492 RepID=UPI002E276F45|nr:low-density lipoprotein receptor-related protein 4-like isoform X2 [Corticium candelabrum]
MQLQSFAACALFCLLATYASTVSGFEGSTFFVGQANNENASSIVGEIRGLDCSKKDKVMCWSDAKNNEIKCSDSESIEKCAEDQFDYHIKSVAWNLESTGGVALDQCNTMVYWTDLDRSTISVMKVGKNNRDEVTRGVSKDILTAEDGLGEPFSIAVDSCAGYIFFTDVETFDVRVARAEMDGSHVRTLVTRTPDRWALRSPQALALDRLKRIVFFGDKRRQEIYKMDYDGNNYMKIARRVGQIYDMALGCKGLGLVYTVATRNDPLYLHVGQSEPYKMSFSVAYKQYYGVCSYCDHCLCQSRNPCSLKNGGCSHLCFTTPSGETRCDCPLGYRLDDQDNTQCKVATDHLLVANLKNLLWVGVRQTSSFLRTDSKFLPIGHLKSIVALDYVKRSGHSYIVYTNDFAVQRSRLDGSETLTIAGGLPNLKGIAADCATGNIYYTDLEKSLIAVSNFDGTLQTVCFSSPTVSKPFSLALNTKIGKFYFSDIDRSAIYEASMDCTGSPKVLVSVYMAAGLTLDESAQLLYWAEFAQASIHYVDLQTKLQSRISVFSFYYVRRPFDMTLLGNYLYITDWVSHCISRVHKTSGSVQGVSCNHNHRLYGIAHLQKTCAKASVDCSRCRHPQMCMLSSGSSSYVCVCPSGFITSGSSCRLPSETFLLAASIESIIAIPIRESASWTARLPLPPQTNIIAIDYDYKGKRVFWTDVGAKNIQSANLDGSNMKTVLSHDRHRDVCRLCVPNGLVYDSTNDRLYYTDYRANEICYVTSDGEVHRVVDGLDGPRSLVVRPNQNKLYFTEVGENATISSLDISSRATEQATPEVLLSTSISLPNALAMSKDGKTLYFGDATGDYVASFDLQSQRARYITNSTHIFALDVYDGYIYWSDWTSGVHKMPVKGGTVTQLATLSDVYRASGIRVFRPKD